jgi:uncharacterized Tic20 family protein
MNKYEWVLDRWKKELNYICGTILNYICGTILISFLIFSSLLTTVIAIVIAIKTSNLAIAILCLICVLINILSIIALRNLLLILQIDLQVVEGE